MTKYELIVVIVFLIIIGTWLTHIVSCLAYGTWGFLVAGALFFPIGIIHGAGIWLGVW